MDRMLTVSNRNLIVSLKIAITIDIDEFYGCELYKVWLLSEIVEQ